MTQAGRWDPGTVIMWRYQWDAQPVRVVRDDEDGLVAWLAPGSPRLAVAPVDGRQARDRPAVERFDVARRFEVTTWQGAGILRLERPGRAHSLWRFRDPERGVHGWYAYLEDPLRRSADAVHTADHILDVWFDDAGFWLWKDEDEMAAVVELGHRSPEWAAAARAEGEAVIAAYETGDPPFDGSWRDWEPDPAWPVPDLAPDLLALDGRPAPPFG